MAERARSSPLSTVLHRLRLAGVALVVTNALACQTSVGPATPRCPSPAPLLGHYDPRAPGYNVVYDAAVDATAETTRLASEYGFTPRHVWTTAPKGFSAVLPVETVAALRCEPSIAYATYEQIVTTQ